MSFQDQYDEAMLDFSRSDYQTAIVKLKAILAADPMNFDAQLALGMSYYRLGDYSTAIAEGHKAEALRPKEQLVHTNLSLFYMKAGDKVTAERHGLQARVASWREESASPGPDDPESGLEMAKPKPQEFKLPGKFPDMPWKKKSNPEK